MTASWPSAEDFERIGLLCVSLDNLADAVHRVGKDGEGPEDRYLEVNSDQIALAMWKLLSAESV